MKFKKLFLDILIFAILITIILVGFNFKNISKKEDNNIAIIHLNGVVGGVDQNSFNKNDISKILNEVKSINPKGIILAISSPGGSVYESDAIYETLLNFKKENGLKIYTSMGEECASGGYYIAMSSDKIFAEPTTITGSIGVILNIVNYEELLNKIGINIKTIKSGKFKDIGSPYRTMSDEEKKILQSIINEFYERFLNIVSVNRKIPVNDLRPLAQGQIYTGKQALSLGLVNGLGNLSDVIETMKKDLNLKDVHTVEFQVKRNFVEMLFGNIQLFIQIVEKPIQYNFSY